MATPRGYYVTDKNNIINLQTINNDLDELKKKLDAYSTLENDLRVLNTNYFSDYTILSVNKETPESEIGEIINKISNRRIELEAMLENIRNQAQIIYNEQYYNYKKSIEYKMNTEVNNDIKVA